MVFFKNLKIQSNAKWRAISVTCGQRQSNPQYLHLPVRNRFLPKQPGRPLPLGSHIKFLFYFTLKSHHCHCGKNKTFFSSAKLMITGPSSLSNTLLASPFLCYYHSFLVEFLSLSLLLFNAFLLYHQWSFSSRDGMLDNISLTILWWGVSLRSATSLKMLVTKPSSICVYKKA